METINPATLRNKPFDELWNMRKGFAGEVHKLADAAQNREYTDYEQRQEETLVKNMEAIDKTIDERMRDGRSKAAFDKFSGLMTQELNQRDEDLAAWASDVLEGKQPGKFDLVPEEQRAVNFSYPGLQWEQRDTLKSTATQAMNVSVYNRVIEYLVEQTPVLRAGALFIQTDHGEDLQVPRLTGLQSGNLISEGGSITESDPTLGVVTLKSYKYAAFWQLSRELVDDSPTNLLEALARGAATAIALAYGPHLATGTGSGQPQGYTVGATVGVTGPTGTGTTFGSQATAGQGSDLIFDLYSSVPEPYLLSPAIGVLGRNATFTLFKKYKKTTNEPVFDLTPVKPGSSVNLLGMPGYVDPHTPAPANTAKSIAFGDWSRYAVRMVGSVRIERSDDFAFQSDLASFKAVVRLDGALLDTSAIKTFVHTT